MNILKIETIDSVLVVDSRLIAGKLNIQHCNFLATIKKYEQELLTFNQLMFQTETVRNSTGALNETTTLIVNPRKD